MERPPEGRGRRDTQILSGEGTVGRLYIEFQEMEKACHQLLEKQENCVTSLEKDLLKSKTMLADCISWFTSATMKLKDRQKARAQAL